MTLPILDFGLNKGFPRNKLRTTPDAENIERGFFGQFWDIFYLEVPKKSKTSV
ncbi:MAG: hypothetical protein V7K21_13970 [Nostoc sp.]|uniref:hypothetical protein n=1 Tax=Nostoc sp. TaxID=1180 RepID=UPI002FFCF208